MRPLVSLERRGKEWVVALRSGRAAYSSPCYAKAVGVFDYLEGRSREMERETRRTREAFRQTYAVPSEHGDRG